MSIDWQVLSVVWKNCSQDGHPTAEEAVIRAIAAFAIQERQFRKTIQESNELSVSKSITSKADDVRQDFQLIHHLLGFFARVVFFARGHGFLE